MIMKGDAAAGAVFSDCELYRYRLWRVWDGSKPKVCFIMLNPSTATHEVLDPTITRCKKRAEALDYGGLEVVNLFALRSTDPKALYLSLAPVGKGNFSQINLAATECHMTICAWGTHGKLLGIGEAIKGNMQTLHPEKTHYLKLNKDGSPAHPLYLDYKLKPILWKKES